ncbi:MAG: hypothetical protein JSS91_01760 [Bacteroidetes bacterium]|nr:hypothetical protein [Bacteroidota bacterium]
MNTSTKIIATLVLISALSIISLNNVFALDYFQKTTINKDKSGTIEIRYSALNSELNGADVYQTLPFKEDKIRAAYTSANNKVQSVNINTKDKDKVSIFAIIKFDYIGKIITAPAFSKIKVTYYENGDNISFMYELPKNDQAPQDISPVYTFILPAKEITKTSGTIKDNSVVYGLKPEKLKSGVTLFANFVVSDKNTAANNNSNKPGETKKEEKEKGSCGLFGIELPLVIGLGYAFSRKFRKKS